MSLLSSSIRLENEGGGNGGEYNFQQVLKIELSKLHKEYRLLENKRHGFAQQDGSMRKVASRLLPVLQKDKTEINHEIRNANCRAHRRKANVLAYDMKEALKVYELYQSEIKKKIKQIQEIETHVDKITDKIIKQKLKLLTVQGLNKSMEQRERDLAKAEDKLYNYTCAFNLQILDNKRIRQEIMDLLMTRERFYKTHNSLKKQLANAKVKMLQIVQHAIQTYDSRDEAMSKIKSLRERETKEIKQHGMEVQEFDRTLHHDKEVLEFIKTKLKERSVFEGTADRKFRIGAAKEMELDQILKKYRKSFKRILAYSHTSSISHLVESYKSLDLSNFEHFRYITNLNSECEVLREAIEILKSKIESAHAEVDERERSQRKIQEKLQLSIMAKQELQNFIERQKNRNKENIQLISDWIAAAFRIASCDASPIMKLLGNNQGVTKNNVRLCMQQLDFKITEMKTERDRLQNFKNGKGMQNFKPTVMKLTKGQSSGGPFFPKIMIGGLLNADTLDEDDARIMEQEPYYYKDMREYMYQKMIEEKIIDPGLHTVSTIQMPLGEINEVDDSKLTLVQKIENFNKTHTSNKSRHTSVGLIMRASQVDGNVGRGLSRPSSHASRDETQSRMYQKKSVSVVVPKAPGGDPPFGLRTQQQRKSTGVTETDPTSEEAQIGTDEMQTSIEGVTTAEDESQRDPTTNSGEVEPSTDAGDSPPSPLVRFEDVNE
ncbi:Coiled-coil domain-containing protein 63 [Orchesella cincta]|uniref:Coiled-coil domain-containing protein 63 n=1 Tax=Orchesella cincta TaxID=48709 RepID=A0A1D2NB03_ORCCI|nr:Coiled-coil domain-containing protein 63 [Orchesella cincta]